MIKKLIWNDIKNNRLLSAATAIFMTVSAMLPALSVLLFANLLGAIDTLMLQARTPDFLQMHTGMVNENEIRNFAAEHTAISDWQIGKFLNLENSTIRLGDYNLADSTQDNGLSIQGERFDYLLDLDNQLPDVSEGEVYVPISYRTLYHLKPGDIMKMGSQELVIGGFIRDSQMNSMMSSSKRFLVNKIDYETMKEQGEEESLIEFLMQDGMNVGTLASAYSTGGLPANGPTITKPLIRMMNALSDGMMIFIIFLISGVVLLISMLCIRFILLIRMEKDNREVGLLKALGIRHREIKKMYFYKYALLSVCGGLIALLFARLLHAPLARQMQALYGVSDNHQKIEGYAVLAVVFVESVILLSVWCNLKKMEKAAVLEALFPTRKSRQQKGRGSYLFIGAVLSFCTFLMILPQNLHHTLSSPDFATYMGIGDGEIRIDIRQTDQIEETTIRISDSLEHDTRVERYTVLQTKYYEGFSADGTGTRLSIELGNHSVFPVKYAEGRFPEKKKEIALSTLNAEELGLSVGDTLPLSIDGKKETYRVCGIYSDITNGGKTAKAISVANRDAVPTIWSVLYVSLDQSASKEQWIEEYSKKGIDVVNLAAYMEGTYGQTVRQIKSASNVGTGVSIFIILVVVTLFMRLTVERNRYAVSLQKALGFPTRSLNKSYMEKGLLSAVAGIVTGLVLGTVLGETICGMMLQSFGAVGFRFVTDWKQVLFFVPAIALITAGTGIWAGILEIKKIKAFECCTGEE